MQPLRFKDVSLQKIVETPQGCGCGADLIGGGGGAHLPALSGEATALAVQRLMLTKFLEEDAREQVALAAA